MKATLFLLIAIILCISLGGLLPWGPSIAAFNQQRFLELGVIAVLSLIALCFSQCACLVRQRKQDEKIIFSAISGVFVLGLISAIYSIAPEFAFLDLGHTALVMLAIVGAATCTRHSTSTWLRILSLGIAAGAGIAAARFFIQIGLTVSTGIGEPLLSWYSPYSNPRFYAQAIIWCLPVFVAIRGSDLGGSTLLKGVVKTVSVSSWTLLIWSGSRGALLGLGLGTLSVFWMASPSMRRLLFKPMILEAALGIMLWALINSLLGWDFVNRFSSLSLTRFDLSGREFLIARSWELIQNHPWLGIGPGQFPIYNFQNHGHSESHPHNIILQLAVEWGVPAASVAIILSGRGILQLLNMLRKSAQKDVVSHALTISMIAFLTLCLVDGPHIMPLGLIAAVLGLGTLIGRAVGMPSVNLTPLAQPSLSRWFAASLLVPGMLLMAPAIWKHEACALYPQSALRALPFGISYDHPRFWVQGRFPIDQDCIEQGRYTGTTDHLHHLDLMQTTPPW